MCLLYNEMGFQSFIGIIDYADTLIHGTIKNIQIKNSGVL